MNRLIAFILILVIFHLWINESAAGALDRFSGSGKEGNIYRQSFDSKLSFDVPEGKYNADDNKWKYKHDNSGKYVHVHIPALPYDGGYGDNGLPYDHLDNPYKDDPFRNQIFNDPRPAVYREYGAPLFGRN